MAQYCPYTSNCPFYENWVKQRKNKRVDVIVTEGERGKEYYDCLTLIALDDPETGIDMTAELKKRLSAPNPRQGCSLITLLNK